MSIKLITLVIIKTVVLIGLIAFQQLSYAETFTRYDACGTADAWWDATCNNTFEFEQEIDAAVAACSPGQLTTTQGTHSAAPLIGYRCDYPGVGITTAHVKQVTLYCGENQYPDYQRGLCKAVIPKLSPSDAEVCKRILDSTIKSCGTNRRFAVGPIPCTVYQGVILDRKMGDDTVKHFSICKDQSQCPGFFYLGEHLYKQNWPRYAINIDELREYCRNYKENMANKKELGASENCDTNIQPYIGSD